MKKQITVDPNDKYPDTPALHLWTMAGMIPTWFLQWRHDQTDWAEFVNMVYAHGGGWQPFGLHDWEVHENHAIVYPGDPLMHPFMLLATDHVEVAMYEHAIVALFNHDSGTFQVARMD